MTNINPSQKGYWARDLQRGDMLVFSNLHRIRYLSIAAHTGNMHFPRRGVAADLFFSVRPPLCTGLSVCILCGLSDALHTPIRSFCPRRCTILTAAQCLCLGIRTPTEGRPITTSPTPLIPDCNFFLLSHRGIVQERPSPHS